MELAIRFYCTLLALKEKGFLGILKAGKTNTHKKRDEEGDNGLIVCRRGSTN